MATTSPWPLIHAERETLIADLIQATTGGRAAALTELSGAGVATLKSRSQA